MILNPERLSRPMTRSQKGLAGFFTFAGVLHFVIPRSYEAMMPPSLPAHREAVAISGVAEIVGGAALAPARAAAASPAGGCSRCWLAVFPANVHMAVNPEQVRGLDLDRVPRWGSGRGCRCSRSAMLWVWRATRA